MVKIKRTLLVKIVSYLQIFNVLIVFCFHSGSSYAVIKTGTYTPTFVPTENPHYCPNPKLLKKDKITLKWTTDGGWQSYETSFLNDLNKFEGAQWFGINIGTMACIYSDSKEPFSFPVIVIFNKQTAAPMEGKWKSNLDNPKENTTQYGYYNCHSNDTKECPFYPLIDTSQIKYDPSKILTIPKKTSNTQHMGF